ncbi:MAG TPA: efflux RND transporter periplasmic adaptor subunit, partial [Gemmataceae bacterium]|nr:efflux RND transporter periplasmic adaptor subunit [Gemmataceae bacterium]
VTGYLEQTLFKEGSEVQKGDLLFVIDPRPYQAQLDYAQAQIQADKTSLALANRVLDADKASPIAVSDEQKAVDAAKLQLAKAQVDAADANKKVYDLNMEFTQVRAKITGQVSRYYQTPGNLINQDSTLLTTIVSLDPMYAYFEMDEPTLLRIRRAIREGRMKMPAEGAMKVFMGLQGEDGYPHEGIINFFNNQVNSATGSISLRGVFPNPRPAGDVERMTAAAVGMFGMASPAGMGSFAAATVPMSGGLRWSLRLLSPGMFVRIRLPIGEPHSAYLVSDGAIVSDQGAKYVYIVGTDNQLKYQPVTTGALQPDGLREIRDGVKPDDWVVVGALQQIHPRDTIRPDQTAMPTHSGSADEEPKAAPKPKKGNAGS